MRGKKRSMFRKPKNKTLSKIVEIDTPADANKSAMILKKRFRHQKSRKAKVATKRATINAANIAGAMLNKKDLSTKEKNEMRKVRRIYRDAAKNMKLKET